MVFKDYYAALGVDPGAGQAEIKSAYRRLARKYHPDVSKEPDAEATFKTVNAAYEVLRDPQKRAAYDRLRAQGYRSGDEVQANGAPPHGFQFDDLFAQASGGSSGFSEFFESLFTNQDGHFSRRQSASQPAGQDQRARLRVSLESVYKGETVRIEVNGRQLDVKVPQGIQPGQVIRLPGLGMRGGHVLLEVEYIPHPLFGVDGLTILHTLRVTPWQAALGASLRVPTLDGSVTLKIPSGSDAGRKLRLRERGLKRNGKVGDQIVELAVTIPKAENTEQRRAYQALAAAFA